MVLIDAVFINESGGKVLLDYLIESIEKSNTQVTYLLDYRVKDKIPIIKKKNNILFLNGYYQRCLYYNKIERDYFDAILCFGNIPPHKKLKSKVYTYFHQLQFVEHFKGSIKSKLLHWCKKMIIFFSKKNSDFWLVQTGNIGRLLSEKFSISKEDILQLPFYVEINPSKLNSQIEIENSYIYVSNGYIHKNHFRLIQAFCEFYDEQKIGQLTLTITPNFEELHTLIKDKVKMGYPIINLEYIPHSELRDVYLKNNYLIFPSFSESFGLGIIEAIDCNCKIIGSNLPYMFNVCKPSLTFEPSSVESIKKALIQTTTDKVSKSVKKLDNKIEALVSLIS